MSDSLQENLKNIRKNSSSQDLSDRRTTCLKTFLDQTWEEILCQHRSGASGNDVVQSLTHRMDVVIQILYQEALLDLDMAPPKEYAILALGGYGRGALNPKSDVDLLFLFDKIQEKDPITRTILHTLWDLHFKIGYSTRGLSDCITAAQDDTDSLTSMLEARYLAGDESLSKKMAESLSKRFFGRKYRSFIHQKMAERTRRYVKTGFSVQLLEPNIKESPGGLRDTHIVGWFLKARRGLNAPEGLREDRLLTRKNYRLYIDAVDFMLRTRNELHFSTGKSYDMLEHDLQPEIALRLGYQDQEQELAVEHFMRDYYSHARNIKHLSDLVCERLKGQSSTNRAMGLIVRRELDDGTILYPNQVRLPQKRRHFFIDNPYRLLNIFLDTQQFGVAINETAQQAIKNNLYLIDEAFRQSRTAAHIFLDILRAPAGVALALRSMHELGVLGAYIPEFETLNCLVQYNRYHIYTADEHTLVTLDNLEYLSRAETLPSDLKHIKHVFDEIPQKELLYLALLMHDVGKSARGEDHSQIGAKMARNFLQRLGLPQEEINTVVFLVEQHLTISHIAQRRDLNDQNMLSDFALRFNHPNTLRMLYILTYADLSAVARTAWTAWKGHLLQECYQKTFVHLTQKNPQTDIEKHRRKAIQNLKEALSDRFAPHLLEEHLNNMPPQYPGMNSAEEVGGHLDQIQGLGENTVSITFTPSGLFLEVFICTHDKPYRLSEICGVLATNDISIFSAQAYTRSDGIVIDTFQVTGPEGSPTIAQSAQRKIRQTLAEIFEGTATIQDLFDQHLRRWSRHRQPAVQIPTEIHFENDISDQYTVIDIFAQDATGLLYQITQTLSDLGLDIYTARIGTQADKAIDSFYVIHEGQKVTSPENLAHIQTTLMDQLS